MISLLKTRNMLGNAKWKITLFIVEQKQKQTE